MHRPLREFPSAIGSSRGEDHPFEDEVVRAVGADDYINRAYSGQGASDRTLYRLLQGSEFRRQDPFSQELPSGLRMGAGSFRASRLVLSTAFPFL